MSDRKVQYGEKGGEQGGAPVAAGASRKQGGVPGTAGASRKQGGVPGTAGASRKQGGVTGPARGTSRRVIQNSGTPSARNRRVMSEREQLLRQQQQQLHRQQQTLKKRLGILSCVLALMLALNGVAAVSAYLRIRRVEEALKTMGGQISTERMDDMGDETTAVGIQTGAVSPVAGGQAASHSGYTVTGQDYVNLCGLENVDRPRERTMEQVLDYLGQLAEEDGRIAEILEDHYKYPDKLLEALANNPEMTDFVMGYEDHVGKVTGGLTEDEMKQDFPLFLQWDPRWGYGDYGDGSHIALAGCGPTCLSMALFYLTGDESLTPDKMAEYSMENGYYISGTGTAWALLQDVPEQYGVSVYQSRTEEYTMKEALDRGAVLICSMGPGDFTAAGHFIVVYGYDKKGFRVNDPNCVARSRQTWSFSQLEGQIKNIWVLGASPKQEGVTYIDATDAKAGGSYGSDGF